MRTAQELTVRKTITVPLAPERAFELFTTRMGKWWPLDEVYSIHGDEIAELVFEGREGGRVYERTHDGTEAEWARVLAFEPPTRLLVDWHVNPSARPTELEVRFVGEADGTRIELEHRGWESEEARSRYDGGWGEILARYAEAAR